jgi:hypothetical protein
VDCGLGLDDLSQCAAYFVELDDVGVSQYFEDADLASHSFDIGLLHNFVLLQGFNGNFFVGEDMHPEPDLPEGALANAGASITPYLPIL